MANIGLHLIFNIIPFAGSISIFLFPDTNKRCNSIIKKICLWTTVTLFIYSLFLWFSFNKITVGLQFFQKITWLNSGTNLPIFYELGVDGISIFFILLTTFIFPLCWLSNWRLIDKFDSSHLKFYTINFLFIEIFLLNAFSTTNLLIFFIFFESVLIPMIFLIGIWGPGDRRIKANYYFIFYTIGGSSLLLFAIFVIAFDFGSFSYFQIFDPVRIFSLSNRLQLFLWLFFFLSFAVKVPMFPFHIWLPEAHVEAPTIGSVILASLLLKLGGYGFIRFIPLFPYAYTYYSPFVFSLAILSILYASMSAIRQIDLKKVIAYSSVAHMNLGVIGIFSLTYQGLQGSLFLLLSHGLVSAALFFLVGMLYDRYYTKLLKYYGGLVIKMPIFSTTFFFFTIANLAFPGTSNFISELLILIGLIEKNITLTFLSGSGMFFSSVYSIWLFNRIAFGSAKLIYIQKYQDLTKREYLLIIPLIILTILFGLIPDIILETTYFSVKNLISYCN